METDVTNDHRKNGKVSPSKVTIKFKADNYTSIICVETESKWQLAWGAKIIINSTKQWESNNGYQCIIPDESVNFDSANFMQKFNN